MVQRESPYLRFASIVTLACFLLNIMAGDAAWAFGPAAQKPASSVDVSALKLPAFLGEIKETHRGVKPKTIIHIQDAHCNLSAQRSIEEILRHLNSAHNTRMIALEGGEGDYDLSVFADIKDASVREKVARYFEKEGRVNGAELFAIMNPDKAVLKGVEDAGLYINNLAAYRNSLKNKAYVDSVFARLSPDISALKERAYSSGLKEFDGKKRSYIEKNCTLKDYLAYLYGASKAHGVPSAQFANLSRLIETLRKEGVIDFGRCDRERGALVAEIQKRASKLELELLASWIVNFKKGHVRADEFYLYLIEKGESLSLDVDRLYPNLVNYSRYLKAYEAVDKYGLFKEMDSFEEAIFNAIADTDEQRALHRISLQADILKKLFAVSLTRAEYDLYRSDRSQCALAAFAPFLADECRKYGLRSDYSKDAARLDGYRDDAEQFYYYALKRDDAFVKNVKTLLKTCDNVILISGGFHTENLKELFGKEGYSYAVILPKFDYAATDTYFRLLSGGVSPAERAVSENTSAIAIASALNHLGVDSKRIFELTAKILAALVEGKEYEVDISEGSFAIFALAAEDKAGKSVTPNKTLKYDLGESLAIYCRIYNAPVAEKPAPAGAAPQAPATADRPLKILAVDDDSSIREMLATAISGIDPALDVVFAENGERALELFSEKGGFDIILTDRRMPGIWGDKLAWRLKKSENPPYIIMMSSAMKKEEVAGLTGQGLIDAFLAKPFKIRLELAPALEAAKRSVRGVKNFDYLKADAAYVDKLKESVSQSGAKSKEMRIFDADAAEIPPGKRAMDMGEGVVFINTDPKQIYDPEKNAFSEDVGTKPSVIRVLPHLGIPKPVLDGIQNKYYCMAELRAKAAVEEDASAAARLTASADVAQKQADEAMIKLKISPDPDIVKADFEKLADMVTALVISPQKTVAVEPLKGSEGYEIKAVMDADGRILDHAGAEGMSCSLLFGAKGNDRFSAPPVEAHINLKAAVHDLNKSLKDPGFIRERAERIRKAAPKNFDALSQPGCTGLYGNTIGSGLVFPADVEPTEDVVRILEEHGIPVADNMDRIISAIQRYFRVMLAAAPGKSRAISSYQIEFRAGVAHYTTIIGDKVIVDVALLNLGNVDPEKELLPFLAFIVAHEGSHATVGSDEEAEAMDAERFKALSYRHQQAILKILAQLNAQEEYTQKLKAVEVHAYQLTEHRQTPLGMVDIRPLFTTPEGEIWINTRPRLKVDGKAGKLVEDTGGVVGNVVIVPLAIWQGKGMELFYEIHKACYEAAILDAMADAEHDTSKQDEFMKKVEQKRKDLMADAKLDAAEREKLLKKLDEFRDVTLAEIKSKAVKEKELIDKANGIRNGVMEKLVQLRLVPDKGIVSDNLRKLEGMVSALKGSQEKTMVLSAEEVSGRGMEIKVSVDADGVIPEGKAGADYPAENVKTYTLILSPKNEKLSYPPDDASINLREAVKSFNETVGKRALAAAGRAAAKEAVIGTVAGSQPAAQPQENAAPKAGKMVFAFNAHDTIRHYTGQLAKMVDEADIVVVEKLDTFAGLYQKVADGDMTPDELIEKMRDGGWPMFRPEPTLKTFGVLYGTKKRVYGEPADDEGRRRTSMEADRIDVKFRESLVSGEADDTLAVYLRLAEAIARHYARRDSVLKGLLDRLRKENPSANILVIRGKGHTPSYMMARKGPEVTAERVFFIPEMPVVFGLREALERKFMMVYLGLLPAAEVPKLEVGRAMIAGFFVDLLENKRADKTDYALLNSIVMRVGSEEEVAAILSAIKQAGAKASPDILPVVVRWLEERKKLSAGEKSRLFGPEGLEGLVGGAGGKGSFDEDGFTGMTGDPAGRAEPEGAPDGEYNDDELRLFKAMALMLRENWSVGRALVSGLEKGRRVLTMTAVPPITEEDEKAVSAARKQYLTLQGVPKATDVLPRTRLALAIRFLRGNIAELSKGELALLRVSKEDLDSRYFGARDAAIQRLFRKKDFTAILTAQYKRRGAPARAQEITGAETAVKTAVIKEAKKQPAIDLGHLTAAQLRPLKQKLTKIRRPLSEGDILDPAFPKSIESLGFRTVINYLWGAAGREVVAQEKIAERILKALKKKTGIELNNAEEDVVLPVIHIILARGFWNDKPGLIGKWVPVTDIEFVVTNVGAGQGYVRFKAYQLDDPKQDAVEIKIDAARAPPGAFDIFKRTGMPEIDIALQKFYDNFTGDMLFLETNIYGIEGIGTGQMLALSEPFRDSKMAMFHEIAHGAIDTGALSLEAIIINTRGGKEALDRYISQPGKEYRRMPEVLPHYALRLFQQGSWGISEDDTLRHLKSSVSAERRIRRSILRHRKALWKQGRVEDIRLGDYVSDHVNSALMRMYGDGDVADIIMISSRKDEARMGWCKGLADSVAMQIGQTQVLVTDRHNFALPFILEMRKRGIITDASSMIHFDWHGDALGNLRFSIKEYARQGSEAARMEYLLSRTTIGDWQKLLIDKGIVSSGGWAWLKIDDESSLKEGGDGEAAPTNDWVVKDISLQETGMIVPSGELKGSAQIVDIDIDVLFVLDKSLSAEERKAVLGGKIPEKIASKIREMAVCAKDAAVLTIATSPGFINQGRAIVYIKELLRLVKEMKEAAAQPKVSGEALSDSETALRAFEENAIDILRRDESKLDAFNDRAWREHRMLVIPAFSGETYEIGSSREMLKVARDAQYATDAFLANTCDGLGYPVSEVRDIVYELCYNVQKRGGGGIVTLRKIYSDKGKITGIEVVARDAGAGIEDVEREHARSVGRTDGRGHGFKTVEQSIFASEGSITYETNYNGNAKTFVYDAARKVFVETRGKQPAIEKGTRAVFTLAKNAPRPSTAKTAAAPVVIEERDELCKRFFGTGYDELRKKGFSAAEIDKSTSDFVSVSIMGGPVGFEHNVSQLRQLARLGRIFKNIIMEKGATTREVVIYGLGLGSEPKEAIGAVRAFYESLKDMGESEKDWKLLFVGVDAMDKPLDGAKKPFGAEEALHAGLKMKIARARTFIPEEVVKIFAEEGEGKKADIILNRHVHYGNRHVSQGVYSWATFAEPKRDNARMMALSTYVQLKNIMETLGRKGAIYAIEPIESQENAPYTGPFLVIPGAQVLFDNASGIYQINDTGKVASFGEFIDGIENYNLHVALPMSAAPVAKQAEPKNDIEPLTARILDFAKDAVRQDSKDIHTVLIVGDDAYRDEAQTKSATQALQALLKRMFGHARGNEVAICRSYKEAAEKVAKMKGANFSNTFIYIDPRVRKDGSDKDFDRFIRTELVTKEDGSVLMAAPVCGYAAYSQLYASLIGRIAFLQSKGREAADMMADEEVRQLSGRMASIIKEMTQSEQDVAYIEAQVLDLVPGLAAVVAGIVSTEDAAALIEKFLQTYITQHRWNLPYAKAVDWDQLHEFFEAQEKALEAA